MASVFLDSKNFSFIVMNIKVEETDMQEFILQQFVQGKTKTEVAHVLHTHLTNTLAQTVNLLLNR